MEMYVDDVWIASYQNTIGSLYFNVGGHAKCLLLLETDQKLFSCIRPDQITLLLVDLVLCRLIRLSSKSLRTIYRIIRVYLDIIMYFIKNVNLRNNVQYITNRIS
jgi:hypothetical protein